VGIPSHCPKCQAEARPGAVGCARCGLLVSRWESFVVDVPSHPALDAMWETLAAGWDDDAAHRRFLDAAALVDALDVAAARYRERLRDTPADARAQAGLERAARLAQSLHETRTRAERPPAAPRLLRVGGTVVAGVVLLATMWVLVSSFLRH
jgi:hypothetical protein